MEDDLDRILLQIDARILSNHASLANLMSEVETPSEVEMPLPTAIEILQLNYWLSKFVVEARRGDGEPYPPSIRIRRVY